MAGDEMVVEHGAELVADVVRLVVMDGSVLESVTSESNEMFCSLLPARRVLDNRSGSNSKFPVQQADIPTLQSQLSRKGTGHDRSETHDPAYSPGDGANRSSANKVPDQTYVRRVY
jgi:hypothetical protein